MRRAAAALAAWVLMSGCAKSVLQDFESARRAALTEPGPLPADWEPDAVLHLAPELVDAIIATAIEVHGTLGGDTFDAGLADLTPRLRVVDVGVGRAEGCRECLRVDASLDGDLGWEALIGSGAVDLKATLAFDAVFGVRPRVDGSWVVTVAPKRVRDLQVVIGGAALDHAAIPLAAWLEDNLLAEIPELELADLGSGEVPLRAVRILPVGRALQVQLLTASPSPTAVPADRVDPAADWQLLVSQDSLLDVARAAAFDAGPGKLGIVPEPTSLAFDGQGFVLGLRLWKTTGRGWWRDYVVRGTVEMRAARKDPGGPPTRIALVPGGVEEGEKSPGAAWADPLAALGEGVILKTIENALSTHLPAVHEAGAEGLLAELDITSVSGSEGVLQASGAFAVAPGGRPGKRRPK